MNTRNFQRDTQIEFGTLLFGEEIIYNIQNVMIPGVDVDSPEVFVNGVKGLLQADALDFQELNITILIDEELKVWKELMAYMFKNVNIPNKTFDVNPAQSWVTIRNSKGEEVMTCTFHDSHITNIGSLSYDSTGEDDELVLDVSIRYDWFEIK